MIRFGVNLEYTIHQLQFSNMAQHNVSVNISVPEGLSEVTLELENRKVNLQCSGSSCSYSNAAFDINGMLEYNLVVQSHAANAAFSMTITIDGSLKSSVNGNTGADGVGRSSGRVSPI